MFTIILVVYDSADNFTHPDALPKAIKSLCLLEGECELIIVNNASPSAWPLTTQYIRNYVKENSQVKHVELDKNYGCGGNFNMAMQAVNEKSDILVYMSCDALIVDPNMLKSIRAVFSNNYKIGALHPLSVYEDFDKCNYSKSWSISVFDDLLSTSEYNINNLPKEPEDEIEKILQDVKKNKRKIVHGPMPQLPLTFYAIRRSLFHELGGFNQEFIAGHENIDIALRALKRGWQSAILRNTFVFHRRLLFRILERSGSNQVIRGEVMNKSKEVWNDLWDGRSPDEVFCDLKYGVMLHRACIRPVKKLRCALLR